MNLGNENTRIVENEDSPNEQPSAHFKSPAGLPPGPPPAPTGPAWKEQMHDKSWRDLPPQVCAELEEAFGKGDPDAAYPFPIGPSDEISLKRMELRRCNLPETDLQL